MSQNTQANIFYEKIKGKFNNSNINEKLDKIINNNYSKLSKNEFEFLGSIAFMYGLDFVAQKGALNKMSMTNFVLRMKDLGLTPEMLSKFQNIINELDFSVIEKSKDSLKDLLLKDCKLSFEKQKNAKNIVDSIFKNSIFPIGFSLEVNELLKSKKYTYANLLKINSFIYENLDLPGKCFKDLYLLHSDVDYANEMTKATDYYELQKFAVVYFDSILSIKEWFAAYPMLAYLDCLADESLLETISEPKETEKIIENIEVQNPEFVKQTYSPDDTDVFIKGILDEKIGEDVNSVELALKSFDAIVSDDDLVQYVYQYMKAKTQSNRSDLTTIFSFDVELLKTKLKEIYDEKASQYKKLVEAYLAEFSPEDKQKIVGYINDIINDIIITNHERKAYLFQQLNENQIHTYKHLQQIIGLIEECSIFGNKINSYVSLRDYINLNDNIVTVFDSIEIIDKIQIELSFYKCVLDFYTVFPVTEETK